MSVGMSVNAPSPRVSLSMATLVCGLLSFFLGLLTAIPGIVIGHAARSKIKDNPCRFGGAKLALAGLMMCYLACVVSMMALTYIVVYPETLQVVGDYAGYSLLLSEE